MKKYSLWLVVLGFLAGAAVPARAGIMIYPKFLLFEDKTKSTEVTLINSNAVESSNYRITLSYKTQNYDGSYTDVEWDESQTLPHNAIPFLRYSPRSSLLAPQKSQTVRLLKRLPEGLAPGDYVAYITFTEVLLEKPRTKQGQNNTLRVEITPIPSFSIPILVRYKHKEDPKTSLEILPVTRREDSPVLWVRFYKEKTEQGTVPALFARADLSVWMGDEMIGLVRGKYLLPGNDSVEVAIALRGQHKDLTWKKLSGKKLKVLLTPPADGKIERKKAFVTREVTL